MSASAPRAEIFISPPPSVVISGNNGFVAASIAPVVEPSDDDLVARLGAGELELKIGILRNRRAPLCREHVAAVMRGLDALDVMGGNDVSRAVLALPGFHLVAHEHAHEGLVALGLRADFHRICHFVLSVWVSRRTRRG